MCLHRVDDFNSYLAGDQNDYVTIATQIVHLPLTGLQCRQYLDMKYPGKSHNPVFTVRLFYQNGRGLRTNIIRISETWLDGKILNSAHPSTLRCDRNPATSRKSTSVEPIFFSSASPYNCVALRISPLTPFRSMYFV